MARKVRVMPSDQVGYGSSQWVVQYYDRDHRVWYDIGDPLDRDAAQERRKEELFSGRMLDGGFPYMADSLGWIHGMLPGADTEG
jgi:hypothetical protein